MKLQAPLLEVTEQPRGASSPAIAALHMPLSLLMTNLATSSSAMFARMNGQEVCPQYTCLKLVRTTIVDIFLTGHTWFRTWVTASDRERDCQNEA